MVARRELSALEYVSLFSDYPADTQRKDNYAMMTSSNGNIFRVIDLRTAQVYCFAIFWHVDTRPISPFLFSLILLFIYVYSLSFFTWCIWYINWSCWQSYITFSVLMFLWYRQKFFISLYGTRVPWVNMGWGQPGSVSKVPPFLWVKLWVGGWGGDMQKLPDISRIVD